MALAKLIIVGSGLTGSVVAERFASAGGKVLVIEKRPVVGGNIADEFKSGVLVHRYGPHIFHTDDENVATYMDKFWALNSFRNEVSAVIANKIVPLPFNFLGIDTFWPPAVAKLIKEELVSLFGDGARVPIAEVLAKAKTDLTKAFAHFVYKNVFENYTTKMWGQAPAALDPEVLKRVPVTIGYGTRYFRNRFEGLPRAGYSATITRMLDHRNIEVMLNTDALTRINFDSPPIVNFAGTATHMPILITAPLDAMFSYCYGHLPYRSLAFNFQEIAQDRVQVTAVQNLPSDPVFTRTTEYKIMTGQSVPGKTVISWEKPGAFAINSPEFGEPYYPINNDSTAKLYEKYRLQVANYPNVFLAGRMALYRYFNMDEAIKNALEVAEKIIAFASASPRKI